MAVLIGQVCGVVGFLVVTLALGIALRRQGESGPAEAFSRVSHLAFWLGLVAPWAIGLVFPGPAALDRLVGLPPLPLPIWARIAAGAPPLIFGVVLMQASITGLARKGKGAPAFKLTGDVVATGVYGMVRNPMALGYYTACVGGALLSGSSWVLLYTTLGVIPAHAINLKFFEELELSLRYGRPYEDYRRSTPFLIPRFSRTTDSA